MEMEMDLFKVLGEVHEIQTLTKGTKLLTLKC
jgi:hypothetical protein